MKANPRQLTIAAIVIGLQLAAVAGRLGLAERFGSSATADLTQVDPLCAGFARGDAAIIGIAHGRTGGELIAAGIERLGLPRECDALALPTDLEPGALIRLRLDEDGCGIGSIERLPGAQRLICGAGIDVNADSARDIELLPGIGPKKAAAIVESRRRDGPFGSLDDLTRVRGIGTKTVERIRPWVEPPG